MIAYEDRVVAFIDIIGFKELVEASAKVTSSPNQKLDRILKVLNIINMRMRDESDSPDKRVTAFSDNVVVSYAAATTSAAFYLIEDIQALFIELAAEGVWIRGGIAVGKLYHKSGAFDGGGDVVVGPAQIKAHHLESKVANYGRVIVDEQEYEALMATASKNHGKQHSGEDEREYLETMLVRDDESKLYYVDCFSLRAFNQASGESPLDYEHYLDVVQAKVNDEVNHPDQKVRAKYEWLRDQYAKGHESLAALRAPS